MNKSEQLKRLNSVAGLLYDSRLSELQKAARARLETESRLAGLVAPAATSDTLPQVAVELAALNYQRWADVRRSELNQTLARQMAVWSDARDAARLAFGKTQALAGIADKLAAARPKKP